MKNPARLSVWLLAILGTFAAVPLAVGQEMRAFQQGTHAFRKTLDLAKVRPLEKLEDLKGSEGSKILIILGQVDVLAKLPVELKEWVSRGGAALIATDRDTSSDALTFTGYQVSQQRVIVDKDSPFAFHGSSYCVFVDPVRPAKPPFHNWRVATNLAGTLVRGDFRAGAGLERLAFFPRDEAKLEGPIQRRPLLFAVGGSRGRGRILLLSDHSVFINAMMLQNEDDNLNFAYSCVDWLTESGKRTQALFCEEGQIQTKFYLPLKIPDPPTPPPPEQVIKILNNGLAGIEEEDGMNRALLEISGGTHIPLALLALIVTIAGAGFAFSRLLQARHQFEPGLPHLASSAPQLVPSVEILEQRHRAILRQGNFWEVARLAARQGWDAILGGSDQAKSEVDERAAQKAPAVPARGNWWQRRRQQRLADRLWRLAYHAEPAWISARRWRRIEDEIRIVRDAYAEGTLHPSNILRQQASQNSTNGSQHKAGESPS